MDSNESNTLASPRGRFAGKAKAVGLLTAGVIAGGMLAGAGIASAATSGTATPSASSGSTGAAATPGTPGTAPAGGHDGGGPGGAASVRSDEKLVTGDNLSALKAAALKAVPGGTIVRVETDAGDGAFEAHMTKADGSLVTVKFDKSLAVASVETGMGKGDPAPAGAPAGPAGSAAGASTTA